ncbi:MAG: hypothetical protein FWE25_01800 [Lachnospiraceae bacterium]|nr:hypothetical protein [Lachnospiraceae bacterium]
MTLKQKTTLQFVIAFVIAMLLVLGVALTASANPTVSVPGEVQPDRERDVSLTIHCRVLPDTPLFEKDLYFWVLP